MTSKRQTFGDRMASLANRRHELFAQGLAKGETQERAMELAGYSPNRGNSVRLKTNESIAARVSTLQERMAIKVEITADDLVAELEEARALARETGQSSAMVAATLGKGKLLGLITDKVVADVTAHADVADAPLDITAWSRDVESDGVTVQ